MRIRPEPPAGHHWIEFGASPRWIDCDVCRGAGTDEEGKTCSVCGGKPLPQARPLELEKVIPIGEPTKCPFYVLVNGVPYAGYERMSRAVEAVKLWCGDTDGDGYPVSDGKEAHWPAARGKRFAIIDNRGNLKKAAEEKVTN